jgi:diadenosine tetraphosphate (Ap4A) HIT family hydrolase
MRVRRKPCHNGPAQLANVVRDGGHFVAEHPGVDEQHASPALHDNGVALAELALVDQHTLRDLPQHGRLPPLVVCDRLLQESSAGAVIVEARRHLLDFGEMTPAELAELGSILNRLVPAIKAATGVQRVYFLALMKRAPHFHLWLVPKKNEGELRGMAYLAQQPPLTTSYSEAEAMSRKIREQFEQS